MKWYGESVNNAIVIGSNSMFNSDLNRNNLEIRKHINNI